MQFATGKQRSFLRNKSGHLCAVLTIPDVLKIDGDVIISVGPRLFVMETKSVS